jgi:hypothetical protein
VSVTVSLNLPEAAVSFLAPALSRALFVANNEDISPTVFQALDLKASDIVVQYNKPMFFDALAGIQCHKVHFVYPNHLNSAWGFAEDGTPELDYAAQERTRLTFMVATVIPGRIRPYLDGLGEAAQSMSILLDRNGAMHSYPPGKLPSGGFVSVSFFRFLNWVRNRRNSSPMQLITLGFTGQYKPGTFWNGHDFRFEQQCYGTWLDLHRLNADGTLTTAT